jgi:hypothetical protein
MLCCCFRPWCRTTTGCGTARLVKDPWSFTAQQNPKQHLPSTVPAAALPAMSSAPTENDDVMPLQAPATPPVVPPSASPISLCGPGPDTSSVPAVSPPKAPGVSPDSLCPSEARSCKPVGWAPWTACHGDIPGQMYRLDLAQVTWPTRLVAATAWRVSG